MSIKYTHLIEHKDIKFNAVIIGKTLYFEDVWGHNELTKGSFQLLLGEPDTMEGFYGRFSEYKVTKLEPEFEGN